MKYFITGGCGFIGTNLALSLGKKNFKKILILDNLSKITANKNLSILKKEKISFIKIDIGKSKQKIEKLIKQHKPRVIFHLAGQVAMSTSLKRPDFDFQGNVLSTINLLESIRKFSKKTILIFSSTNILIALSKKFNYIEKTRFTIKNNFKGFSEKNINLKVLMRVTVLINMFWIMLECLISIQLFSTTSLWGKTVFTHDQGGRLVCA